MTLEWRKRIEQFMRETKVCVFRELGPIEFEGLVTDQSLTPEEALKRSFKPMPEGTKWGAQWEYGWFRATVSLPEAAENHRIQLVLDPGGESMVYVNGVAAGGNWHGGSDLDRGGVDRICLTQKAKGGAVYQLLLETYAGHGVWVRGSGPVACHRVSVPEPPAQQALVGRSAFGIWNEEVYQLLMDVQTLWHLRENIEPDSLRVSRIDDGLKNFTNLFDPELPWDKMVESAKRARETIRPLFACVNGSTTPELFAFGHAHIDVAWFWPLQHTERKIGITLANQLALAGEYPEYRFLQSQPHLYTMLERRHPEVNARVKAAVNKGQIMPDGGMWVEADTNITGGESLIRQFLHGKRFFKDRFGIECELLWLPDVFGYSAALPQIMKGCGIRYFSSAKIFTNYYGGESFPYNTFLWEGLDGSEMLTHLCNDYNSQCHPGAVISRWNNRVQKDNISTRLFPFGWSDGGGGPTRDHLEYIRRQRDLEGAPKIRITAPTAFFKDLEKRGLPEARYVGELYYQATRGTYTSQSKIKRGNRKSEFSLREAELWSAFAMADKKAVYPAETLHDAWQKVLLNQFHDILPGSSIARVCQEAEAAYAEAIDAADKTTQKAQRVLATSSPAFSVFNSLNWERTALVALPAGMNGGADSLGNELPAQEHAGMTYVEIKVPSCGFAVGHAVGKTRVSGKTCTATPASLENEVIRATFNEKGEITSLFDKECERELAAGACNSLKMYRDVPSVYDAWDIDSMYQDAPVELPARADIRVLAQGPLFAAIGVSRKLNNSLLKQEILLRRGSRRIDFKTAVEWNEKHKLLKVNFPVNIRAESAVHEIQFGHLRRPNHVSRQFDADRFEVCCQKWTALMEEDSGCAVLNDCKYGVNVLGNSINLTLLRSPVAPDSHADLGLQEFTYSFYAWNDAFAQSALVREAYGLNAPVRVAPGGAGDRSFLSVDAPNIVVEAVKAAEDGSGDIIVRIYDSKRVHTRGTLAVNLPLSRAWTCDMLENRETELPILKGRIPFSMMPFQILTLRLTI